MESLETRTEIQWIVIRLKRTYQLTNSDFKKNIAPLLDAIAPIGDADFQRRSWFGQGEQISSPNEMICHYFDDCSADEVVESASRQGLRNNELLALQRFHNELSAFVAATPSSLDPDETLQDPRWVNVRKLARAVIEAFQSNHSD